MEGELIFYELHSGCVRPGSHALIQHEKTTRGVNFEHAAGQSKVADVDGAIIIVTNPSTASSAVFVVKTKPTLQRL